MFLDTPIHLGLAFYVPRNLGVFIAMAKNDLQGTLDLLVLKTLDQSGALHGYGNVLHIQNTSDDLLRVEEGSLYPALHRMEQNNKNTTKKTQTKTKQQTKYYK